MPNLTLSIPEKTKARMDKHASIRWSNAVRITIEQKLDQFEEAERLAKKGRLTDRDFETISKQMDEATRKHAQALLDEHHR